MDEKWIAPSALQEVKIAPHEEPNAPQLDGKLISSRDTAKSEASSALVRLSPRWGRKWEVSRLDHALLGDVHDFPARSGVCRKMSSESHIIIRTREARWTSATKYKGRVGR